MGRRTNGEPAADQSLLRRLSHALDLSYVEIAQAVGTRVRDIRELDDPDIQWQRDETWWNLRAYVDSRLGMLIAVQADLDRRLQKDRTRLATLHARVRERAAKPSPRSRKNERPE